MADQRKQRPRHANREGKPWQRGDGRWIARVWPPEGSIETKPRYVYGKTMAEAKRKRDDLKAKLAQGTPQDPAKTVGEYLEHWLDVTLAEYQNAGEIAESTVDSYRDNARLHIIPALGHVKLTELSVPMVRQWQDQLTRKPTGRPRRKLRAGETVLPPPPTLSARTVAYNRQILRKALEDAIRDEVAGLDRNVVARVTPAKDRMKKAAEPIRPAEASALLIAAAADPLWCYWLVAFAVGFRRGEGLGMRWSDLDLERRVWRPTLSVQRLRGTADPKTGKRKGKLVAKELKSQASTHAIALPASVTEALEKWQREQLGIRSQAKVWADLDLVFTTKLGTAIEPRNINRAWERVCAAAGTRIIRLHDLRHACASYLLAAGVDVKSVQNQLRHSRLSTTELYLHALEDIPTVAADAMDKVLVSLQSLPPGTTTLTPLRRL